MSFNPLYFAIYHHNDGLFLDERFLDAMEPEIAAIYKEFAKAIKLNDKSDAIKYTMLKAVVDAMKANDRKKMADGIKAIQGKFNEAEAKQAQAIKEASSEQLKAQKEFEAGNAKLKERAKVASMFQKVAQQIDGIKGNPKGVSRLQVAVDKLGSSKLSDKCKTLVFMASSGKDVAKDAETFKKAVEAEKKAYDKATDALSKGVAKAKNTASVQADKLKALKEKQIATQKEKLIINGLKVEGIKTTSKRGGEAGNNEQASNEAELKKISAEIEKVLKERDAVEKKIRERCEDVVEEYSKYMRQLRVYFGHFRNAVKLLCDMLDANKELGKNVPVKKSVLASLEEVKERLSETNIREPSSILYAFKKSKRLLQYINENLLKVGAPRIQQIGEAIDSINKVESFNKGAKVQGVELSKITENAMELLVDEWYLEFSKRNFKSEYDKWKALDEKQKELRKKENEIKFN